MNTSISPTVNAPCGHEVSASSPHCDWCVAEFLERRGHDVGRAGLVGVNAGLAFDIFEDGRVTAYMLRADVVAFDSGGLFDAWVASEQQVVGTPHVVVAQPTFPVAVPARDVTEFCGLVSEWATLLLPVVEWAIKHVELEGLSLELASWADSHGVSPNGVSFIVRVASLLAQALVRLEVGESGS